jgi:hypothetical protein
MWCCVIGGVVPEVKEHDAFHLQRSGSLRRACLTPKDKGSIFALFPYFKLPCLLMSVTRNFVISVQFVLN